MQTFQLPTKDLIFDGPMHFSPDGRWLAFGGDPVFLLDIPGRRKPFKLSAVNDGWGVAFVRGGAALAYAPEINALCVYDLASRKARMHKLTRGAWDIAGDLRGETIYLSAPEGKYLDPIWIRVTSATTFKVRAKFNTGVHDLGVMAVSADGRWLAATTYERVFAWNVGGAKPPARAALDVKAKNTVEDFALSADGSRLAVVTQSGLEVWDTASRKRVLHSGKHRRGVTAVAYSPTAPLLVTGDTAGGVFMWDAAGNVLTRYDWKLDQLSALAFAPDGLRCAAVDCYGKVVIWDVDV